MSFRSQAIVVQSYGPPSVLALREVEVPDVPAGHVRVRNTRIGVNFHDVYCRSGAYQTLSLPGIPGIEAAGVVEEVGSHAGRWKIGDRVAYVTQTYGAYARHLNVAASMLEPIPADLSDAQVASVLLRGLTVDVLLNGAANVQAGDTLLVQAASGGVGQLLTQWASRLGARVFGTVRDPKQVDLARINGCHEVILQSENVPRRVMQLTDGRGVDVAYDGVGQATLMASLASLAYCAHLVNFGQSSGMPAPLPTTALAARSTTLVRPIVFHYLRHGTERAAMTQRVFQALREGVLKVREPREFPLANAADSHALIEREGASSPILLAP